jgi:hypothetical protein
MFLLTYLYYILKSFFFPSNMQQMYCFPMGSKSFFAFCLGFEWVGEPSFCLEKFQHIDTIVFGWLWH